VAIYAQTAGDVTLVTGNSIAVTGSGAGIHAEGPLVQSLIIRDSTLSMGTGTGMVIATPVHDGSVITRNTISSSASAVGILVASPRRPNTGGHVIQNNVVRGFAAPVSMDRAKHPGGG
jgi:hypothetical protein